MRRTSKSRNAVAWLGLLVVFGCFVLASSGFGAGSRNPSGNECTLAMKLQDAGLLDAVAAKCKALKADDADCLQTGVAKLAERNRERAKLLEDVTEHPKPASEEHLKGGHFG
jgi:hypothetical protein